MNNSFSFIDWDKPIIITLAELKQENQQLKEVIEEARKYIEENPLYYYVYDEEELYPTISEEKARKELLQILDKVKKGE